MHMPRSPFGQCTSGILLVDDQSHVAPKPSPIHQTSTALTTLDPQPPSSLSLRHQSPSNSAQHQPLPTKPLAAAFHLPSTSVYTENPPRRPSSTRHRPPSKPPGAKAPPPHLHPPTSLTPPSNHHHNSAKTAPTNHISPTTSEMNDYSGSIASTEEQAHFHSGKTEVRILHREGESMPLRGVMPVRRLRKWASDCVGRYVVDLSGVSRCLLLNKFRRMGRCASVALSSSIPSSRRISTHLPRTTN